MNNLEKLAAVGKLLYGDNWQSPISRALGVSDRTIRNFVSGKSRPPVDMSARLTNVLNEASARIAEALALVQGDQRNGADITPDSLADIAGKLSFPDEMARQHAIDAMNNSIYPVTYLSDLEAVACKFSSGAGKEAAE